MPSCKQYAPIVIFAIVRLPLATGDLYQFLIGLKGREEKDGAIEFYKFYNKYYMSI